MATTTKAAKATKKTVNKTVDTVEEETLKASAIIRKGALAYVGLYGAAYEQAQTRFAQVREARLDMFEKLVKRGEKIEADAKARFEDVQEQASDVYADTAEKVKSALPIFANDRTVEVKVTAKKPAKKTGASKAKTTVKKTTRKTTKKAA